MKASRKQKLKWGQPKTRILLAMGYYDREIHCGVARYCRESDWSLDSSMSHYGVLPRHWAGEGIITLFHARRPELTAFVKAQGVPYVNLSKGTTGKRGKLPPVGLDNAAISELVVRHFLDRGYRNFAFLRLTDNWVEKERREVFEAAVKAAGRRYQCLDGRVVFDPANVGDLVAWLATVLPDVPLPLAVMAQDDQNAALVLRACELAMLGVPEQIALCGVDNEELICENASVPLSSVDCDLEGLGYEAAKALHRLMQGKPPPKTCLRIAPKGLVIRKSTDMVAIPDVDVATAVSFIRDHFRDPIGVGDVAAQTSLGRRRLHDAFVKHTGHGVSHEITRMRLEHAIELLRTTDHKLAAIADEVGFSSAPYMSAVFQRELSRSPGSFRTKQRD